MDEEKVYLDETGLTRVLGKDKEYVDEKDGYRAIDTIEGVNSSSTGAGFFYYDENNDLYEKIYVDITQRQSGSTWYFTINVNKYNFNNNTSTTLWTGDTPVISGGLNGVGKYNIITNKEQTTVAATISMITFNGNYYYNRVFSFVYDVNTNVGRIATLYTDNSNHSSYPFDLLDDNGTSCWFCGSYLYVIWSLFHYTNSSSYLYYTKGERINCSNNSNDRLTFSGNAAYVRINVNVTNYIRVEKNESYSVVDNLLGYKDMNGNTGSGYLLITNLTVTLLGSDSSYLDDTIPGYLVQSPVSDIFGSLKISDIEQDLYITLNGEVVTVNNLLNDDLIAIRNVSLYGLDTSHAAITWIDINDGMIFIYFSNGQYSIIDMSVNK